MLFKKIIARKEIKINGAMMGLSYFGPYGWLIGGGFFLLDMAVIGLTGENMGEHLDRSVKFEDISRHFIGDDFLSHIITK